MPFTDVINDYSNGATGTLTDINGYQVGYTVTGTSPTLDWNDLEDGARVNANGTQQFEVTFDNPVVGAAVQMSGSDSNEIYFIVIDGVTVDLNTLIANGDVTFTQSGAATHQIDADGSIFGGTYQDGSIAELVFNIPVTSIGVFGTNGNSGNWDYFEVGIDNTLFDIVCFAQGTHIETQHGKRAVEGLRIGDRVLTQENGLQPIRWIGSRRLGPDLLKAQAKLRPIRIRAGALGQGTPDRDLVVSRQHRVVVASKIVRRMFARSDVLIPAVKLIGLAGVEIDTELAEVTYYHLLFDRHEIIFAQDAPAESLYLGREGVKALSADARAEIQAIFPNLHPHEFALPVPFGSQQKRLMARHLQNKKPVLELFSGVTR